MIDDLPLRTLASAQHGIVSIEQAVRLGYGRHARHALIDGRRWERIGPRVIGLVGAPPSQGRTASIAVLSAGRGAALCGPSAAAWWGIPGNLLEPLHVVRDRDGSTRAPVDAAAHEPKLLPPHHVVVLDSVRTVVPARALFDVAGRRRRGAQDEAWVERVARMVDTAWAMRLVSGRSLHALFDEMAKRGRSGTRVMRLVLADRGVDYIPPASGLESRFAQILARAGLPPMRRQIDSGGDRWIGRVDFRAADVPVLVEIQSERFHSSLIDSQLDADRLAALRAAGFVVVEITETDVFHRPYRVVRQVEEGLALARSCRAA
ncbi:MAG TPA: hypothetical protein VJ804_10845 [Acidimicrobiales bacterium]|nr:hypothetical protein [Acidimicrobiales bacterium]